MLVTLSEEKCKVSSTSNPFYLATISQGIFRRPLSPILVTILSLGLITWTTITACNTRTIQASQVSKYRRISLVQYSSTSFNSTVCDFETIHFRQEQNLANGRSSL